MFPGELPLTEEATARLTALSEFQDLGSGMRIAMRDLEIRGAGSGSGVGRGINAERRRRLGAPRGRARLVGRLLRMAHTGMRDSSTR